MQDFQIRRRSGRVALIGRLVDPARGSYSALPSSKVVA
jgi:hypothetical protein